MLTSKLSSYKVKGHDFPKIPFLGLQSNYIYLGNDLKMSFTEDGLTISELPTSPFELNYEISTEEPHEGLAKNAEKLI